MAVANLKKKSTCLRFDNLARALVRTSVDIFEFSYVFGCTRSRPVPKSWLSMDDLISPDFDDDLKSDEFLSSDLTGCPEGMRHEEVHNF